MLVGMTDPARIQAWLLDTIRLMVEYPDDVNLDLISTTTLQVRVNRSDRGKLIGKTGPTARSLRTILGAIGMAQGSRYRLDIGD